MQERGELRQISPVRVDRVPRQVALEREMRRERVDQRTVGPGKLVGGRHVESLPRRRTLDGQPAPETDAAPAADVTRRSYRPPTLRTSPLSSSESSAVVTAGGARVVETEIASGSPDAPRAS